MYVHIQQIYVHIQGFIFMLKKFICIFNKHIHIFKHFLHSSVSLFICKDFYIQAYKNQFFFEIPVRKVRRKEESAHMCTNKTKWLIINSCIVVIIT